MFSPRAWLRGRVSSRLGNLHSWLKCNRFAVRTIKNHCYDTKFSRSRIDLTALAGAWRSKLTSARNSHVAVPLNTQTPGAVSRNDFQGQRHPVGLAGRPAEGTMQITSLSARSAVLLIFASSASSLLAQSPQALCAWCVDSWNSLDTGSGTGWTPAWPRAAKWQRGAR